jgi:hypothetical protein
MKVIRKNDKKSKLQFLSWTAWKCQKLSLPFSFYPRANPIKEILSLKDELCFKFSDCALIQFKLNYSFNDCFWANVPFTILKSFLRQTLFYKTFSCFLLELRCLHFFDTFMAVIFYSSLPYCCFKDSRSF